MASTILVKDALWRVSDLLQDVDPQYQRYPERELVRWLNDAQAVIAKFLPSSCSRIDSIKLRAGNLQSIATVAAADCLPGDGSTRTAPLYGTSLIALLCNMGPNGATPGDAIRVVDRRQLDAQARGWHAETALKVSGYVYDPMTPRQFLTTPGVPAGASVWVRMSWTVRPDQIPAGGAPGSPIYAYGGSSAQALTVDDEYLDDIVNYAVARANLKATEWADASKAGAFTQLFVESINAKVTTLTGTNPNLKRLPMAGEPIGAAS